MTKELFPQSGHGIVDPLLRKRLSCCGEGKFAHFEAGFRDVPIGCSIHKNDMSRQPGCAQHAGAGRRAPNAIASGVKYRFGPKAEVQFLTRIR